MKLGRDEFGKLLCDGEVVTPVRAHPISAPDDGLSLIGTDGHERAWIPRLAELPADQQAFINAELAQREFHPQMQRLVAVSTFSTPSQWTVETDKGPLQFLLKSEEDIRRLGEGRLLISSNHGLQLHVPDRWALDRHSRRLLERFL
ncbi:MAG: DUF1854 domain-containing protein [Burkholderiales bacterium]|jgi:hypothetical protein